jgi:hypothetical protein
MTIKADNETVKVTLDPQTKCATVTNGIAVPLTINVGLALKIVMHSMKNGMYSLDELFPLSKLSKRILRDTQQAQEELWGVSDDE